MAAAGEEDLHPLLSFDIGRLTLDDTSGSSGAAPDGDASSSSAPHAPPPPASGPAAAHGYDLLVSIVRAANLPAADWWNGLADPYVAARLASPGGAAVQYRTSTAFKSLNPVYDEFFEVGNVPAEGCTLEVEVWDKDLLTPDDMLGSAAWRFEPQQPQQAPPQQAPPQQQGQQQGQQHGRPPSASASAGSVSLQLQLQPKKGGGRGGGAGMLMVDLQWRPSEEGGETRLLGPVRFRQQLSPVSGLMLGHWNDDRSLAWSTWKVLLCFIDATFGQLRCPWNRSYAAAQRLFQSRAMLSGVRSQHAALYATHLGRCRVGVLRDPADFFCLFHGGLRGGERRYFTYSLCADGLRCSETGASFFTDMMSKHAMHAGGAEEVLFAGEFCIVPEPGAPGGHRLVIDNNSGTYAPPASGLPLLRDLLAANFPGMSVETLACDDPRLEAYHLACPSRLKPAVAREVRAAGSAPSPRSSAGDTAAPPQPLRDSLSGLSADSQNDS